LPLGQAAGRHVAAVAVAAEGGGICRAVHEGFELGVTARDQARLAAAEAARDAAGAERAVAEYRALAIGQTARVRLRAQALATAEVAQLERKGLCLAAREDAAARRAVHIGRGARAGDQRRELLRAGLVESLLADAGTLRGITHAAAGCVDAEGGAVTAALLSGDAAGLGAFAAAGAAASGPAQPDRAGVARHGGGARSPAPPTSTASATGVRAAVLRGRIAAPGRRPWTLVRPTRAKPAKGHHCEAQPAAEPPDPCSIAPKLDAAI